MPKRDILLYNSASRGFTTNLGSDTVRIQQSSDDLLSIQDSSVEQLKVGTLKTSLTFNSPLTASVTLVVVQYHLLLVGLCLLVCMVTVLK